MKGSDLIELKVNSITVKGSAALIGGVGGTVWLPPANRT